MTQLKPCPLCGGTSGYVLHPGESHRWWSIDCAQCGRTIDDCRSDRRTNTDSQLPASWPAADEAWNEAAAYADKLLADRAALLEALKFVMSAHGEQLDLAFQQAHDVIRRVEGKQ